ncbi:VRR-NUC domain protein [Dictyocaulus viviparus]|uniref:Fanconi-associated nuclease n=1 Tax=Dictyocaulus viviparus TaxID=29172 RepID=A0A0D8X943_DICVI|nr:VRR-NUC domain protein [Dictyocaulus viviparus]
MGEDRMKFVQNHITADELVEKIDDLFTSFRTYVSCQKATSDQDNLEESRSVPYIVKSTLKIMRRVLLSVKMDGSRYDESFWLEDCSVFHRFLGISKNARELFMRMVLRKPFWMSLTKLKDRYSELSSSIDPALVELLDNDLIEGEKNLSCLQDALKIAPLPVLRTMAKKYQLDFTKGKVELISTLTSFAATQKSLFGQMGAVTKTMLKAFILLRMEQGAIKFPAPNPCQNIISIFGSKMELMAYMDAKELETEILGFLSSNKFPDAYECAVKARELLTGHCEERAAGLPVFLRRFTTFAVLMRCIIHGTGVLERQKKYAVAISWQRFLLKTPEFKPFCANSRGALWDRLALNLDAHMKEREEALQEIEEGMNDDAVAAKDKLMLQDRAMKISNRDFLERIIIREPVKKEIYGITLSKNLGDSRVNRFVLRDSNGEFVQCAVEEVVRKHYLENEGFNKGVHAEGSIWHTVLGLLFYDIIFDYDVKNVWFSELQITGDCFGRGVDGTDNDDMECAKSRGDDFLFCCPRLALLSILKRIVMDYRNCRSGFPDLTMWNTVTRTVAVIEVKGPNDRLSTKQRLWLDFFMSQDIRAEVCHVIAKNEREL